MTTTSDTHIGGSGLEERLAVELHKVRDPEDHGPNAEVCWYCRSLASSLVPFIRAEVNR